MAKSVNVTRYDLGGSGSNIVPDGFIKAVEKVWIDTYTYSSAATIGNGMIVEIAQIPVGKKVTGIEVYGISSLSATSTNNVSIGARYGSTAVTNSTQFLAATTFGTATWNNLILRANANLCVEVTGASHRIFLQFGGANPSVTAGTLTTKVYYT